MARRRRYFWQTLLVVAVLAVALAAATTVGKPERQPANRANVLLVSIDSLRADRVHSLGNARDTSPTLDALARDGILFRNAVSSSSWTIPAHMTLLTGMLPGEHGVVVPQRRLRDSVVTLAEALRDSGYATAGFVSGPTVRAVYGFAQGFETFDDDTTVAPNRLLSQKGITSPMIARLVTEWLIRWNDDGRRQPFFLFVHLWDVHYDYEPPAPYDAMFDPDYQGTMTSDGFEMNPLVHAGMPAEDLAHLVALYDGELRFTDEHIGKIVARLRDLKVLDDTLVVVTSDHGDEFFEHGGKGHGRTLFEEVVHIPLVMRYPLRLPSGLHIDRQVRLVDVAPTILGLAGVSPPPGFGTRSSIEGIGGRDLSPWLADSERAHELPELPAILELRKALTAVRTNEHKLVVHLKDRHPAALFDLRKDPEEKTNLLADGAHPEVATRLAALFERWRSELAELPRAYERWNPDSDLTRRLEALGYVKRKEKKREKRRRLTPERPVPAAVE